MKNFCWLDIHLILSYFHWIRIIQFFVVLSCKYWKNQSNLQRNRSIDAFVFRWLFSWNHKYHSSSTSRNIWFNRLHGVITKSQYGQVHIYFSIFIWNLVTITQSGKRLKFWKMIKMFTRKYKKNSVNSSSVQYFRYYTHSAFFLPTLNPHYLIVSF